ncbi:ribonucleoside-diphosphate reductase subunit alpha [candidate division KSB1 bacterium]|nr:ribonucleoside-diphosphate reductase subunit alpha [candidate division KSB1 bacterium]
MERIVVKRDGAEEKFRTRKIVNAIFWLLEGLNIKDDYGLVYKILKELDLKVPDRVTTEELDYLVLKAIEQLIPRNTIYDRLATRQLLKIITRRIDIRFKSFIEYIKYGVSEGILKKKLLDFDLNTLQKALDESANDVLDYFGLSILQDRYFSRDRNLKIIEKPQWFFMRVAMGIGENEEKVIKIYRKLSNLEYLHSTPTLYNSGTVTSQYSSCYINVVEDDLQSIMDKVRETSQLAKYAGGVGTDVTRIRATGSRIHSLNARSSGIIPFIKIFDSTVNAIQQGGRRRSSQVVYIQPWHMDVEGFLDLKETTGNSYLRTPSLNTALWMPDEIMRRIDKGEPLYLFDPAECPELVEATGNEFGRLSKKYIKKAEAGQLRLWRKIDSREFFKKYLFKLAKTGHPWLTFKDAHNRFNPCPEYGVINSSNLCTEISIPNSSQSTAVCTLASVNLSRHVNTEQHDIDWDKLRDTLETMVGALDNIMDRNFYPSEESKRNTMDLRPMGIGLMGFAEALLDMGLPYDSDQAVKLAGRIGEFMRETVYRKSEQLAESKGAFPHYIDMQEQGKPYDYMPRRNALLLAIAPTASISIIAGTTSTIDSYFSNIYSRDTLSGKFIVVNKKLMAELEQKELWNDDMYELIKSWNGSVQHIPELDGKINKELYKSAYEISPYRQIGIAAAFQRSVDQAVSKSIYIEENLRDKMEDIYIYAWKQELKSTYYCFIDKTVKGEKYTSKVNKRGERRGFGKHAPVTTDAVSANGNGSADIENGPESLEAEAREKYGDEVVDRVISGDMDGCPTDPLLAKICPSCE